MVSRVFRLGPRQIAKIASPHEPTPRAPVCFYRTHAAFPPRVATTRLFKRSSRSLFIAARWKPATIQTSVSIRFIATVSYLSRTVRDAVRPPVLDFPYPAKQAGNSDIVPHDMRVEVSNRGRVPTRASSPGGEYPTGDARMIVWEVPSRNKRPLYVKLAERRTPVRASVRSGDKQPKARSSSRDDATGHSMMIPTWHGPAWMMRPMVHRPMRADNHKTRRLSGR